MTAASEGPARQESRLVAIGPCGCIRIALVLTATTSRADVKSLRRRAKLRGYTVRGMAASEIASARCEAAYDAVTGDAERSIIARERLARQRAALRPGSPALRFGAHAGVA